MDLTNYIFTMSQTADADKPSLFPFPFSMHLIFVVICVVFFAYRFTTQKKPYQVILGLAVLASMCLWLSDSRAVYYGVGALEATMIVGAFITSLIFRDKKNDAEKKDDNSSDDDNNDDNDGGDDSDDSDDEDELTALNAAATVNNILNS